MSNKKKVLDLDKVSFHIMKISFKIFLITVIILVFYFGMGRAFNTGYQIFSDKPVSTGTGRNITVEITKNESTFEIARDLEKKGVIKDSYAFIFQRIFFGYRLYPGTYTLNTSMTIREILDTMSVLPENVD